MVPDTLCRPTTVRRAAARGKLLEVVAPNWPVLPTTVLGTTPHRPRPLIWVMAASGPQHGTAWHGLAERLAGLAGERANGSFEGAVFWGYLRAAAAAAGLAEAAAGWAAVAAAG